MVSDGLRYQKWLQSNAMTHDEYHEGCGCSFCEEFRKH